VTDKQQAQNSGQGSFPAPKQMEKDNERNNDLHGSSDGGHRSGGLSSPDISITGTEKIDGSSNSFSVNRTGSIRPRGVGTEDRKAEVKNEQNTNANPDNGRSGFESDNGQGSGRSNRENDEVKHEKTNAKAARNFGIDGTDSGDNLRGLPAESFSAVRLALPVNQASFDAGKNNSPHVQNEQENNQSATCGEYEPNTRKQSTSQSREVAAFDLSIFCVDPIKSSANRWRIRIRCRKSGCKHSDHLHLKTISFMSDSAFKKLTGSKRKYELWKKATIAENAGALRKGN